jgi:hypothetical protein
VGGASGESRTAIEATRKRGLNLIETGQTTGGPHGRWNLFPGGRASSKLAETIFRATGRDDFQPDTIRAGILALVRAAN